LAKEKAGEKPAHRSKCPKVLNSPEDAHLKSMSAFEADEHLQGSDATHRAPSMEGSPATLCAR